MAEVNIKLNGWQAIATIVIIICIVIVRLSTFSDKINDAALMQELELQVMTEYFPDDVATLKRIYASGDEEALENAVASVTTRSSRSFLFRQVRLF